MNRNTPAFVLVALSFVCGSTNAQESSSRLPIKTPAELGMDGARLAFIDEVTAEGLDGNRMPGCVVLVGRSDGIAMLKAYGNRQLKPEKIAMATDTIFDLASLTKPVATATSIMIHVQNGDLKLTDKVARFIPEFAAGGKQDVTVEQLLTHQSGLIPDNPIRDYEDGADEAMRKIYALTPNVEPGTKFIYSDVGFIVLAEIVARITNQNIHEYSQKEFFDPLGMLETGYLPGDELKVRTAATEQRGGRWMRGEVHDPRAFRLGGIAGHAGLFSSAEDLAIYARMMLGQDDAPILKASTIQEMTRPRKVSGGLRALGWDKKSAYSSNRGDLFTPQAFGHGGFTGTAIWIDPGQDLFVIFLSNRVHPDGKGSVNTLIGRIGTIAAAAVQ